MYSIKESVTAHDIEEALKVFQSWVVAHGEDWLVINNNEITQEAIKSLLDEPEGYLRVYTNLGDGKDIDISLLLYLLRKKTGVKIFYNYMDGFRVEKQDKNQV